MKIIDAAFKGKSNYPYRRDQKGAITGVKLVQPGGHAEFRPCFEVTYPDGDVDYAAIGDGDTYEIMPLREQTDKNAELERMARIICEAIEGAGTADARVFSWRNSVLSVGGGALLPKGLAGAHYPLWWNYHNVAVTVLKVASE